MDLVPKAPIEIIERVKRDTEPSWESYVNAGISAREHKDNSQWILGDLANEVCTAHWDKPELSDKKGATIATYARDIGFNVKSLQEYARVAACFPKEKRIPILSFRHHQIACKKENADELLKYAADNNLTTESFMLKVAEGIGAEETKIEDAIEFIQSEKQEPGTIAITIHPGDYEKIEDKIISKRTTIGYILKLIKPEE